MAIITVSRQTASLGDEVSAKIAERLGYKFIGKKELEKRIVSLGFPASKLSKFDERKMGFLAGLTRWRDEYLNHLMTAILEAASENNCVIVGRGAFILLKDIENHISCRFIANEKVRNERIRAALSCNTKAASKKISESEIQQKSFLKDLFNFDINDPAMFDLVVNTSALDVDSIVSSIDSLTHTYVTGQKEAKGMQKIEELLIGQRIVNMLVFVYNIEINFLRTTVDGQRITLHGIAESKSVADKAFTIVSAELPGFEIKSLISVSRDFKAYS